MGLKTREQSGIYATILGSDGTIRVKCEETTPGAVKRDWETQDGKSGTKFELVYHELSGMLNAISFKDGDYGTTLNVEFLDGEDNYILQMPLISSFAEDFMKKVPAINLSLEVTIKPFNFVDQKGKTKKGLSIAQGENRINDYFVEYDEDNKKFTKKHGFPVPNCNDKDDWKIYFMQTRKWLREYMESEVIPTVNDYECKIEKTIDEEPLPNKITQRPAEETPMADSEVNVNEVPFD